MLVEMLLLILALVFIFDWWLRSYWKRRNIFSVESEFLFGNIKYLILKKHNLTKTFGDMYNAHKEKGIIGFYSFYSPMLLITDPEIIQRVLVTDFNSFADNGFILDKDADPTFGINPFAIRGIQKWKDTRAIQAVMQTVLRLKEITPGLQKVGKLMTDYLRKQKSQPVDLKDLATRYTVDNAVLSAYGVEPASFTDTEFQFIKHASGEKLFDTSYYASVFPLFAPFLSKLFSIRIVSKEAEDFFVSAIKTNVDYRLANKVNRGDLIDNLIKINQKKLEQKMTGFSDLEMAGHCITFYLDSIETSSNLLCFMLLELANNRDIQERLRMEIDSVGKQSKEFDYDKLNSLEYLQMILNECSRVHAPVSVLSRICTKEVTIRDVKIPKDTKVFISTHSLHYDSELFPKPMTFDPERFSKANKDSIVKYSFLPFGEGPRICAGQKYAMLQLKMAVVNILLNFKIVPCNGEKQDISHDPAGAFIIIPPSDAMLKFESI